jgi:hypothetical protein
MSMTLPPGRSYKYYTGIPLWPFGFGLSLTHFNFTFTNPKVEASVPSDIATSSDWDITVRVTNDGKSVGCEVVFVFFLPLFSRPVNQAPSPPLPIRQLIDFKRTAPLSAGKEMDFHFTVNQEQLSTVDGKGVRSTLPGTYEIQITNGHDQMLTQQVTVK